MTDASDEKLDRIVEAVQRVNVNLEGLRVTLATIADTTADHERRIRAVERWQHNVTPVLAAITFTLGAVFSVTLERLF